MGKMKLSTYNSEFTRALHPILYSLFLFLMYSCSNLQDEVAKKWCPYVSPEEIQSYKDAVIELRSLEYNKALKQAERWFKEGHCIHNPDGYFHQHHWARMDPMYAEQKVYNLFSGSNAIVAQDVVLIIGEDDRIVDVRIYGWGM